jgi:hypothetical protein
VHGVREPGGTRHVGQSSGQATRLDSSLRGQTRI